MALPPSKSISQKAMDIIGQFSISHALKVVDSLITETAIEGSCLLTTANLGRYQVISGLDLFPSKP